MKYIILGLFVAALTFVPYSCGTHEPIKPSHDGNIGGAGPADGGTDADSESDAEPICFATESDF